MQSEDGMTRTRANGRTHLASSGWIGNQEQENGRYCIIVSALLQSTWNAWLDQMHGMQTCISKIMDHLICPDPRFLHRCLRRCTAQSSQLQKLPEDIPSLSTCTGRKDVLVAQTTRSPCFLSCSSFPTATQRGGALALGAVSL